MLFDLRETIYLSLKMTIVPHTCPLLRETSLQDNSIPEMKLASTQLSLIYRSNAV